MEALEGKSCGSYSHKKRGVPYVGRRVLKLTCRQQPYRFNARRNYVHKGYVGCLAGGVYEQVRERETVVAGSVHGLRRQADHEAGYRFYPVDSAFVLPQYSPFIFAPLKVHQWQRCGNKNPL